MFSGIGRGVTLCCSMEGSVRELGKLVGFVVLWCCGRCSGGGRGSLRA